MSIDGREQLVSSVAGAPLTYSWLTILFATTRVQRRAGPRGARRLQRENSTNLVHLQSDSPRVLVASLFWLDGRQWWPYVPVFVGLVGPAERRLRWWRWLLIGATAHVVVPGWARRISGDASVGAPHRSGWCGRAMSASATSSWVWSARSPDTPGHRGGRGISSRVWAHWRSMRRYGPLIPRWGT